MPRFLLLLLLATPVLAQRADLRAQITPLPDRVAPGARVTWTATIENHGPDAAEYVEFVSEGFGETCVRETIALAPGERRTRDCSITVPRAYYGIVAAAALVTPYERDPNHDNNHAVKMIDIDTPPDLIAFPQTFPAVDPGLSFPIDIRYVNAARTPATNVTLTINATGVTQFEQLPPNCTASGSTVTCMLGTIGFRPGENGSTFRILAVAPDLSNEPITITTTISANEPDFEPENNVRSALVRTYLTEFVTNTNDSGPGSLRDAITKTNAACSIFDLWCKVAFRMPVFSHRPVIRPASPLPAITGANVAIDGTTQGRYYPESNLAGPEVELSGELLRGDVDGLVAESCEVGIAGLAIHSFPRHGIFLAGKCAVSVYPRSIDGNYIGTDGTGKVARPNLRGIYVDGTPAMITNNVISGNTRSGIWIENGLSSRIFGNIIGLTPERQPLGNGASGIYLAPGAHGTDVFENFIGFNAHAGVSIGRQTGACVVSSNSYQANGGLAVDRGLDGPTLDDVATITNAYYDAARDETVVEGTAERLDVTEVRVHLFANDARDDSGYGEGQYVLGMVVADAQGRFRYVHSGPTPGRFLSAIVERYKIYGVRANGVGAGAAAYSTEFGRTVEVQFPPR